MPEYLVIRLGAEDQPVEWMLADDTGTRRSEVSNGSLSEAAVAAGDRPVIALVPAVDILTTTVNMPVRSASKIRTALPFALEENLAQDIGDLHFAIGDRRADNRLPVAVVAHERMAAWLDRLTLEGIRPAKLIAENHGLAKIPGTLSLLLDGDTVMFNNGADEAFVMQSVQPSDVLVVSGQLHDKAVDDGAASGHVVVFCTPEKDQQLTHEWIALRQEMHSVDVNVLPDGVFPKLAITVAAGNGINLLQGKYGKKTEYSALFRPWKAAAILLLALSILSVVAKGIDLNRLENEKAALQSQFMAEYRQLRPDDTREIVDPQSLVESLKRAMGATVGPQVFLPGLRELGTAMAENSSAKIEAISYRAGVIDLRLTAPDVPTLDRIQQTVNASGRFSATIQSTDQVADTINGRIQIRESGQ
ncbi:MAG TPA: type II secretion system protein GspL [Woeseiaceae bacterium]|nr:type II secretion system protein GspL [Woeseiaceae bacterium]